MSSGPSSMLSLNASTSPLPARLGPYSASERPSPAISSGGEKSPKRQPVVTVAPPEPPAPAELPVPPDALPPPFVPDAPPEPAVGLPPAPAFPVAPPSAPPPKLSSSSCGQPSSSTATAPRNARWLAATPGPLLESGAGGRVIGVRSTRRTCPGSTDAPGGAKVGCEAK